MSGNDDVELSLLLSRAEPRHGYLTSWFISKSQSRPEGLGQDRGGVSEIPAKIGPLRRRPWHPRLLEIGDSGVCLARSTASRHRQTNSGETHRRECSTEADDSDFLNTTGSATGTAWRACHREDHLDQAEGIKRGGSPAIGGLGHAVLLQT